MFGARASTGCAAGPSAVWPATTRAQVRPICARSPRSVAGLFGGTEGLSEPVAGSFRLTGRSLSRGGHYVAGVPADTVLRTEGLTKAFGDAVAVDHLDLELHRGEVFGYLGPNGAGKTTTLRLLLGLLHPTAGAATVLDLDPWADTVELHRRIAYVPGEFAVWPSLTGAEMLDLLGNLHGGWDAALRAELCERFEFDPSRKGRTYSRGNRQKIALIAALMVRPELLVMDEPTSGLDPLMEVRFREVLAEGLEHGQTALLSSHILSEVDAACATGWASCGPVAWSRSVLSTSCASTSRAGWRSSSSGRRPNSTASTGSPMSSLPAQWCAVS